MSKWTFDSIPIQKREVEEPICDKWWAANSAA